MAPADTVGKPARNAASDIPEVLATAYGFSLDSQSETTDETSLISRSAWLKQAKMAGRASVMIWCSHSGKDAQ